MDVLAVVLALVAFALLYALIAGNRPHMSGADLFGLIVSAIVCLYLLYALLRGERF